MDVTIKGNVVTNGSLSTRRALMLGLAQAAAGSMLWRPAIAAETLPKMTVTRDPNCGCCGNWVAHVKAAGFPVEVIEIDDVAPLKAKLGVPDALTSHVPAEAIKRLLTERPKATGLAVPGMPVGSPGMEIRGQAPDAYEVVIFSAGRQNVFARYRGLDQI